MIAISKRILDLANILTEDFSYIPISEDSYEDESDFNIEDRYDEINKITKESGIHISNSAELKHVCFDNTQNAICGLLFCSNDSEEFSFDVIVPSEYQRQGISKKLVNIAIEEYKYLREAFEDLKLVVDVVNPMLAKYLLTIGFKKVKEIQHHTYLEYENI